MGKLLLHRAFAAVLGLAWLGACSNGQAGSNGQTGSKALGACPSPDDTAEITFGCVSHEPPVVKATGPCSVMSSDAGTSVFVQGKDTGTCHVDLTFASGATSSVDVNFMAKWRALGDDPHGCGQAIFPISDGGMPCYGCQLSVPEQTCDAGH